MNHSAMSINLKLASVLKKTAFSRNAKSNVEATAFQEQTLPLKHNLFNFIFKSLNFDEDAHDVYQETILRAFKYLNTFSARKGASFKTWLYTIAHNEIKNYFRKNINRPESLESSDRIKQETGNTSKAGDIYEIAANLEIKNRKVFFLFYYNQFSIKEISEITGLKEGNIKFILHQARSMIKKQLGVTHD